MTIVDKLVHFYILKLALTKELHLTLTDSNFRWSLKLKI